MLYRKKVIDIVAKADGVRRTWCNPKKALVHIGSYIVQPETWVKRFEDAGLPTTLWRGNKTVRTTVTADEFEEHGTLLRQFICEATIGEGGELGSGFRRVDEPSS
jgi:hypothetical protein